MSIEKLLNKKELIIVCGVGGVGKTTLSAALALKGALLGQKTLVITVDPAKRLADILGLAAPCPEPKLVWKKTTPHPTLSHKGRGIKEGGCLWACLLEAKHTFDHLIHKHAPQEMRETILNNPLYTQVSLMLAGTQEYMAMEKLYSLAAEQQFDLIVVDTPPAQHAIDFLLAPMRLMNMLNDSLLRWLIAPALKMGSLSSKILAALSNLSGKEILEDIAQLMHTSLTLLDGFTKRSSAIQTLLAGKSCAYVMVTDSHRALALDGQILREEFSRLGYELEGLLINRMPPHFGSPKEIEKALHWVKHQTDPACLPEAKAWLPAQQLLQENVRRQKELQKKLAALIASVPCAAQIPEQADTITRLEDLQILAECL